MQFVQELRYAKIRHTRFQHAQSLTHTLVDKDGLFYCGLHKRGQSFLLAASMSELRGFVMRLNFMAGIFFTVLASIL